MNIEKILGMNIDNILWTIAGLFLCGMWIYSIGILFVLLIANPPLILGLSLFLIFLVWLFRIEYKNMDPKEKQRLENMGRDAEYFHTVYKKK